jgi:hypothetical protein
MTSAVVKASFATPAALTARGIDERPVEPSQAVATGGGEKPTARVQFEVSSRSLERLKALKGKIEANSYAEVVKNALRLYEVLLAERENGSQFLVRDVDGNLSPLRLFV